MIRTLIESIQVYSILRKTAIGVVAAAAMVGSAQAATMPMVDITGSTSNTHGFNNFADELNAALGGNAIFLAPTSLSTVGLVSLVFTAVAAESGYSNSFTATGAGSLHENWNFYGDNTNLLTSAGLGTVTGNFNGLLDGLLSFTNNLGLTVNPGDLEFGVFTQGGAGQHSVFFLAFDDNGAGPDDNHDDFLIRVNVVPLPAGGLLLIGGLGALAAIRRRKGAVKA